MEERSRVSLGRGMNCMDQWVTRRGDSPGPTCPSSYLLTEWDLPFVLYCETENWEQERERDKLFHKKEFSRTVFELGERRKRVYGQRTDKPPIARMIFLIPDSPIVHILVTTMESSPRICPYLRIGNINFMNSDIRNSRKFRNILHHSRSASWSPLGEFFIVSVNSRSRGARCNSERNLSGERGK